MIAAVGEPSFDPYFVNNELRDVSAHIFQALFDWRGADPYTINPALAETWEETDTTLTVTLRKGVLFHNGREVVAQDCWITSIGQKTRAWVTTSRRSSCRR